MGFNEQYKDERWLIKKREILRRDKWTCQACGKTKVVLHVHHLYYEMDCYVWDYDDEVLVTLCIGCHEKIHNSLKKVAGLIAFKILCCEIDLIELDEKLNEILNYY